MKKALLFTFAIMMMASCADQMVIDTKTWVAPAQVTETSKIDDLMAQAKWGDGSAYLKLAECYKDGLYGAKPDFLATMTMLSMAREYGGISNPRVFLKNLPEDDDIRLTYEGMEREHIGWQLTPDGRYYMDEDGYGMTDDEEITIYGQIDQQGKVVKKFK